MLEITSYFSWTHLGAVLLLAVGITAGVLFDAEVSWLFQPSKRKPSKGALQCLLGLIVAFLIAATTFAASGKYVWASGAFIATGVLLVGTSFYGYGIISKLPTRRVWALVASVFAVVGLVFTYQWCCPPVTINPTRLQFEGVSLLPGSYQSKDFHVSNPSDKDLYNVSFVLRSQSPSIGLSGFRLSASSDGMKIISDLKGDKFGDISCLTLVENRTGHHVAICSILHLSPGESRDLTLARLDPAEVGSYSKVPYQLFAIKSDKKVPKKLLASPVTVEVCITNFNSTMINLPAGQVWLVKTPASGSCQ